MLRPLGVAPAPTRRPAVDQIDEPRPGARSGWQTVGPRCRVRGLVIAPPIIVPPRSLLFSVYQNAEIALADSTWGRHLLALLLPRGSSSHCDEGSDTRARQATSNRDIGQSFAPNQTSLGQPLVGATTDKTAQLRGHPRPLSLNLCRRHAGPIATVYRESRPAACQPRAVSRPRVGRTFW